MRYITIILISLALAGCSAPKSKMIGSLQYGSNYTYMIGNDSVKKLVRNDSITQPEIQGLLANKKLIKTGRKGRFTIKDYKADSVYIIRHKGTLAAYNFCPLTRYEKGTFYKQPCIKLEDCNEKEHERYIVVGKRIYFDQSPDEYCNRFYFGKQEYDAEYKVLEDIEGNFKNDTIVFKALSEGPLGLENSEYALLFIESHCGRLQLVYRTYNNLYKTTDGKWASPVNGYNYNYQLKNKGEVIPPVPIAFKEPITFPLQHMSPESIIETYPAPFYEIKDSMAIAKYGYYLPELLLPYQTITEK